MTLCTLLERLDPHADHRFRSCPWSSRSAACAMDADDSLLPATVVLLGSSPRPAPPPLLPARSHRRAPAPPSAAVPSLHTRAAAPAPRLSRRPCSPPARAAVPLLPPPPSCPRSTPTLPCHACVLPARLRGGEVTPRSRGGGGAEHVRRGGTAHVWHGGCRGRELAPPPPPLIEAGQQPLQQPPLEDGTEGKILTGQRQRSEGPWRRRNEGPGDGPLTEETERNTYVSESGPLYATAVENGMDE